MTNPTTRRIPGLLIAAVLLPASLLMAGCDSSEVDESDYAAFTQGAWQVGRLAIRTSDGGSFTPITERLRAEYVSVLFTFVENDTQGRRFEIFFVERGSEAGSRSVLGDVQIDGESDVLILFPDAAAADVIFEYVLGSTTRITLRTEYDDGGRLLDLLFDQHPFGEYVDVEVVLEQDGRFGSGEE